MLIKMMDGSVLVSDSIVNVRPVTDVLTSKLPIGSFYSPEPIAGMVHISFDEEKGFLYDNIVENKVYRYGVEILTSNKDISFKYMFNYPNSPNTPSEVMLENIEIEADNMCTKICTEIMPHKRVIKLNFEN